MSTELRTLKSPLAMVALAMVLALLAPPTSTLASSPESIDIPLLVPGEANEWQNYYPNIVFPPPNYKTFVFEGTATNPDPDNAVTLEISFDYQAIAGIDIELIPLDGTNVIPKGAVDHPVSAHYVLDFCPDNVSIHFAAVGGNVEDISGLFHHDCHEGVAPIMPTLSEWSLIIFSVILVGWMAWVLVRRRRAGIQI